MTPLRKKASATREKATLPASEVSMVGFRKGSTARTLATPLRSLASTRYRRSGLLVSGFSDSARVGFGTQGGRKSALSLALTEAQRHRDFPGPSCLCASLREPTPHVRRSPFAADSDSCLPAFQIHRMDNLELREAGNRPCRCLLRRHEEEGAIRVPFPRSPPVGRHSGHHRRGKWDVGARLRAIWIACRQDPIRHLNLRARPHAPRDGTPPKVKISDGKV